MPTDDNSSPPGPFGKNGPSDDLNLPPANNSAQTNVFGNSQGNTKVLDDAKRKVAANNNDVQILESSGDSQAPVQDTPQPTQQPAHQDATVPEPQVPQQQIATPIEPATTAPPAQTQVSQQPEPTQTSVVEQTPAVPGIPQPADDTQAVQPVPQPIAEPIQATAQPTTASVTGTQIKDATTTQPATDEIAGVEVIKNPTTASDDGGAPVLRRWKCGKCGNLIESFHDVEKCDKCGASSEHFVDAD